MNELSELEQMQKIIEEYKNSTDMKLVEFAEKFLDGQNKTDNWSKYELGEMTNRQVEDIKRVTGVDTIGFVQVITPNTIRHIENRHGIYGMHDKSMKDLNDIARVKYVLDNYDTVEMSGYTSEKQNSDESLAKVLLYSKRINGTIYTIETVPDNKSKTAYITSMYKKNAELEKQAPQNELSRARCLPLADVRNAHELPHMNSIPQKQNHVKQIHKKSNDDRER